MQDDLERCVAELERARQDLQEFSRAVSHELKTPLWVIGFCCDLLQNNYRQVFDPETASFVDAAADSVKRMGRMLDDLLEYSRVGSRGEPLRPTSAEQSLRQALALLESAVEESGATITHDSLPAVSADGSQLVQLFRHLVDNALTFRRDVSPEVHVSARRADGVWEFSVRDNGLGFDPQQDAERIFTVFETLHGQDDYPGTGIGLAICRRIIERHGGTIRVDSQPGQGSTFYFTLPATDQPPGP